MAVYKGENIMADRSEDLIKGNLVRALITFSMPLILSGVLQQMYSWADAFIVGNIEGESALSAIGSTNVITNLFVMAITGFMSGVSILAARYFGEGNKEIQKRVLSSFTVISGIVFTFLSVGAICFSEEILLLLETPEDIFITADNYLRIVLAGMPFITIYNVYAAVLRGIGDSRTPFYSVIVSSAANVILDIVFVAGLGWGAEGAALATVLSQVAMAVFTVCYSVNRYEILRFCFDKNILDASVLKRGCALSLPIMVQSVVTAAGNLVLQNFMNSFGSSTVAAITTAYRIDCVILLPVINLGTGIATITSQNIGAGQRERARKGLAAGLGLTAGVSVCLSVIVVLIGGSLIELFGVTPASARIGRDFFHAIAWFYIIFGSSMAMRGYLEGIGQVVFSGTFSILTLAVRIVLSYEMLPLFGNMVIAYAEAFAWCFQFVSYAVFIFFYERKQTGRIHY